MPFSRRPRLLPEKNKKDGLSYAFTQDGLELPVIDTTHPSFHLEIDEAKLESLLAEGEASVKAQSSAPAFLQRAFARRMAGKSMLAREILASRGGYMDGMGTYVLKLGPDNLGEAYASDLDRAIASGIAGVNARLRLQCTARLTADGLAPRLAKEAGSRLSLINIAGGAASDSLNALIILAHERPELITNRNIVIHVLDSDAKGPAFARAALASLLDESGALHGLSIELRSEAYDWRDPGALRSLIARESDSIVALSSEGGLFEYACDDAIRANLEAAVPITGAFFVGTLSRSGGASMSLNAATSASVGHRLHDGEDFRRFVSSCGWSLAKSAAIPLGEVFRLFTTNTAREEESLNG